MTQPNHAHQFIAPADPAKTPLALLHGPGGNEYDPVPLAEQLARGSPVLAVRGTVASDGGFAFFHRLPDRSIDEADICERTPLLADFIPATMVGHDQNKAPIAIGFSHGAIMAAALLLTRPRPVAGAIMFRPLSPLRDDFIFFGPRCLLREHLHALSAQFLAQYPRVKGQNRCTRLLSRFLAYPDGGLSQASAQW
jgi:phospholipase/carboxylesterase